MSHSLRPYSLQPDDCVCLVGIQITERDVLQMASLTIENHAGSNGCWVSYSLAHGRETVWFPINHQADLSCLQLTSWMSKPDIIPHDDQVPLTFSWRQKRSVISFISLISPVSTKTELTKREPSFQVFGQCSQNGISMRHSIVAQHPQPASRHKQHVFHLTSFSANTDCLKTAARPLILASALACSGFFAGELMKSLIFTCGSLSFPPLDSNDELLPTVHFSSQRNVLLSAWMALSSSSLAAEEQWQQAALGSKDPCRNSFQFKAV